MHQCNGCNNMVKDAVRVKHKGKLIFCGACWYEAKIYLAAKLNVTVSLVEEALLDAVDRLG